MSVVSLSIERELFQQRQNRQVSTYSVILIGKFSLSILTHYWSAFIKILMYIRIIVSVLQRLKQWRFCSHIVFVIHHSLSKKLPFLYLCSSWFHVRVGNHVHL